MHDTLAEIVETVEADRAALLSVSERLTQAQLDFRLDEERWSVGENLDHLAKVEKGIARLLQVKLAEAQTNGTPASAPIIPSQLTSLDGFQIANNPRKIKSPDRVTPRHGVARAELFGALETTRRDLRDATRALAEYDLSAYTFLHPALGEINLYQWILFIGQHERRHLCQINAVLAEPSFPSDS